MEYLGYYSSDHKFCMTTPLNATKVWLLLELRFHRNYVALMQ